MKTAKYFFIFQIVLFLGVFVVNAQEPLKADAGENQHFCHPWDWLETHLGGNPTASGGTPPYTYRWWVNIYEPLFIDTTSANPGIVFLSEFIAYVEVTDAAENIAVDSVTITISKDPYHFLFDNFPIKYYISQGDSVWVTLDNIIEIEESYTICHWKTMPGLENYNICSGFWVKPDITTAYYLAVTDEHSCMASISPWNTIPIYIVYVDEVGINENSANNQVSIFPNPAKNVIHIAVIDILDIHAISLINMQGQIVRSYEPNTTQLDVSDIMGGIYFIKLSSSKGDVVEKIVITK